MTYNLIVGSISIHISLNIMSFADSVAYQWGVNGGVIRYVYPPERRPDTSEDLLSLGFITPSFDAVLARIDSLQQGKEHDYIQLEIVSTRGKVFDQAFPHYSNPIPPAEGRQGVPQLQPRPPGHHRGRPDH